MKIDEAIEFSLANIARHGDTDIFPFPIEKIIFHDHSAKCKEVLLELHGKLDDALATTPPDTIETLVQVGYSGFRWATQIEPFWNAYYLALTISLAQSIEDQRIPTSDNVVFSYRYEPDKTEHHLFSHSNWLKYRRCALDKSKAYKFAVTTDIADFYSRIYHHRLENALRRLPNSGDTPMRIMKLLGNFSKNVSYGLPVGGPASRILSELCLDNADRHLVRKRFDFCRYSDDYTFFCNTKAEAHRLLVFLSETLFNEGLTLQKTKTRIQTAEEFQSASKFLDPNEETDGAKSEEQKLLNIAVKFDPYSNTPEEDYQALKAALVNVDIVGILGREVSKTAIDTSISKRAIRAIRALDSDAQWGAILTLLEPANLEVLSPVFPTVMQTLQAVYSSLDSTKASRADQFLVDLYHSNSYMLSTDIHIAFYIQLLARQQTQVKEEILIDIYSNRTSPMLRRLIILTMTKWKCYYWLTDTKRKYAGLSEWEKRYFIGASYALGDEGKHWRTHTKSTWSAMDEAARDWFSGKSAILHTIPV